MDRMIAGQANKVIAIELEISQRTVEIHRSALCTRWEPIPWHISYVWSCP